MALGRGLPLTVAGTAAALSMRTTHRVPSSPLAGTVARPLGPRPAGSQPSPTPPRTPAGRPRRACPYAWPEYARRRRPHAAQVRAGAKSAIAAPGVSATLPRRWSPRRGTRERGAELRGCPRNCKRRARPDTPLEPGSGKAGRRAPTREPGDLPSARRNSNGPRAEGERDRDMTTTTLATSGSSAVAAARARRPPRPLHRRLRRLRPPRRRCTTPATTTGTRWPFPATEERPVTCSSSATSSFLRSPPASSPASR